MRPAVPPPPPISDLPVEDCIAAVRTALADEHHAVLQAPPGAGKSTIVPLRLLHEPWLAYDRILVLEPRRLAAKAAARRMADLVGEEVGGTVGYRTRDDYQVSKRTHIEVVTEGILTRRLQRDPSLPGTGLVIFDEIHERNLDSDLALALTLDARSVLRPDLRVLAMSATLDATRVAELLGRADGRPAPVVTSDGRQYPVDIQWHPPQPRQRPAEAVVAATLDALQAEPGDVLVFLPGAAEIRRVRSLLGANVPPNVDVRPLFGALSVAEQDAALAPSPPGRRRVVLSTDIAETSLTVEGVRVVVDSGLVRSPRYDARTGLTRLHTGPNSRASADQRAGRAGRTEPGVAYRVWTPGEHEQRRAFAPPEITMVDLARLALEVAVWGTPASDLAFLDVPPERAWGEARTFLAELGAVDAEGHATDIGRRMADLPIHPRLSRMVLGALERGEGAAACALAALLEERDVFRGSPDELHADITERVRLVIEPRGKHPLADVAALQLVRRRARDLARRVRIDEREFVPGDPTIFGPLLALAYPDRLAQAKGNGRFRLRHGFGAWVAPDDPLVREPFLVVAELGPGSAAGPARDDHRIRLAAVIDAEDIAELGGDAVVTLTALAWDPDLDDLRQRTERRLGALVLSSHDHVPDEGDETLAALLDRVRVTKLGILTWTDAARALQTRVGFAHRELGGDWPDVSDEALLATLGTWLVPHLQGATRRPDLQRVDVLGSLRDLVGHHRLPDLDRVVPTSIPIASGRKATVDYTGDAPTIAVRAQELYGTTTHPTIAEGRVPVVVQLLSPAGRPIQVTADLPGFWKGSWSEVRKDMAGRYPKHDWPVDPSTATPQKPRGR